MRIGLILLLEDIPIWSHNSGTDTQPLQNLHYEGSSIYMKSALLR
jgi:hypothetical protein